MEHLPLAMRANGYGASAIVLKGTRRPSIVHSKEYDVSYESLLARTECHGWKCSRPATGMLTHTLLNDVSMKIMLFGFAAGHELAAHKAPMPTTLHFLRGEATLTVGTESHEVEAGALIHMQPELMHGIVAKTPVTMLLYQIKAARQA